jgi:serine/threonine protein kinase
LLLQERYWVKRLLGEGGFSKTYEVDDCAEHALRERGTPKVLKVLLLNDSKAVTLFQQEARVLSQLLHPVFPASIPMATLLSYQTGDTNPYTAW